MDTLATDQQYQPEIFSVHGRIGRLRYLAYSGIVMLCMVGAAMAIGLLSALLGDWLTILAYPLMIAMFAGTFVMAKRRANDINISGWWVLTFLIPLVNLIAGLWLTFAPGTRGNNKYGPEPAANTRGIVIFAWVYAALFVLGIIAAIAFPSYLGVDMMNRGAGSQESVEARF